MLGLQSAYATCDADKNIIIKHRKDPDYYVMTSLKSGFGTYEIHKFTGKIIQVHTDQCHIIGQMQQVNGPVLPGEYCISWTMHNYLQHMQAVYISPGAPSSCGS